MRKADVIAGAGIKAGLSIVGLSSTGQASYEDRENSGIGSNGLTSARHDLLGSYYRQHFPETFDPQIPKELVYTGPYRLMDKLPGSPLRVGEALLSPTRSYAPVVAALLANERRRVRGIVHCSGGGQTKCLRFGREVHFVKDRLMAIPAVFKTIQRVSKTPWKEMYQVYNMGHRMEIYCLPRDARAIIAAAKDFGIEAQVIGRTEKSDSGKNQLSVLHGKKTLRYLSP
jgi:phosphoribosylformylglycinamidine cyclo-ligase